VAYELCFDFAGRVHSYNGAYLSEYAGMSPGTALTAAVIEAACERGRTEYDMLRGAEGYKTRWSDTYRSELQAIVPADRWRSRLYPHLGPYLKSRLKRSRWLREIDDRISGFLARGRHGG
jgi:CelD/BcsL family acetyltransferase involved in cellulose biosynthesis